MRGSRRKRWASPARHTAVLFHTGAAVEVSACLHASVRHAAAPRGDLVGASTCDVHSPILVGLVGFCQIGKSSQPWRHTAVRYSSFGTSPEMCLVEAPQ